MKNLILFSILVGALIFSSYWNSGHLEQIREASMKKRYETAKRMYEDAMEEMYYHEADIGGTYIEGWRVGEEYESWSCVKLSGWKCRCARLLFSGEKTYYVEKKIVMCGYH